MDKFTELNAMTVEDLVAKFHGSYHEVVFADGYNIGTVKYLEVLEDAMKHGHLKTKNGTNYKKGSIKAFLGYAKKYPVTVFPISGNTVRVTYDHNLWSDAFASGSNQVLNNSKMGLKFCLMYIFYSIEKKWAVPVTQQEKYENYLRFLDEQYEQQQKIYEHVTRGYMNSILLSY